ncbi:MAG: O-antigen ligase family protein [Clostridia bacterium]|nr:O-antigen ligase family protein [Clostridia bacterium]
MKNQLEKIRKVRWSSVLLNVLMLYFLLRPMLHWMVAVPQVVYTAAWNNLLWFGMAGYLLGSGRIGREQGGKLLLTGVAWMIISAALRGTIVLNDNLNCIAVAVYAYVVCYGFAFCLQENGLKRFLQVLCACWTAIVAAMSVLSVISAVTGVRINNMLLTQYIAIDPAYMRLNMFDYCTFAAALLSASMVFALLGAAMHQTKIAKLLYIVSLVPMYAALCLTDGRTAIITFGLGLGLFGAIALWHLLQEKGKSRLLAAATGLVLIVGCIAAAYIGMPLVMDAVNNAAQKPSAVMTAAGAESEAQTINADNADEAVQAAEPTTAPAAAVKHRKANATLSGRTAIWEATFNLMKSEPDTLLIGTTPAKFMDRIAVYNHSNQVYGHSHCMYLQILAELGIPGFILCLLFLWQFAKAAWKLVFGKGIVFWKRYLAVLPVTILVSELIECVTLVRENKPTLGLLLLSMGAVIALARMEKLKANSSAV